MQTKITVRINLDKERLKKARGLDRDGKVTEYLRNKIDTLCDPYIPMLIGDLKTNKRYPSKHEITYTSPYARYQYYGKLMLAQNGSCWAKEGEKKKLTNKDLKYHGGQKRGAKWEKRMMNDRGNEIINDLQKYVNGGK